jgi:hypothetical protein
MRQNIVGANLLAMKLGIAKPVNYDKDRGITQEEKENPVSFYFRLERAFRKYANIDTCSREGQNLLSQHFITQSTPGIRRKLLNCI